ncbi:MAG TPA: protease pro-enzyme activation domain-containing protein, partial [Candidatus Angelobacter sp.]|nr:protease pro-enzyme activation domain-containing protein [Candidatus Angelobacter sp.]
MKLLSSFSRNSLLVSALIFLLGAAPRAAAQAQSQPSAQTQADAASVAAQTPVVPARITQAIDESQLVTLKGNVHPLARPQFDQGPVSDATPMKRVMLLLQRSPEQEAALQQFMAEQMSNESANFHKWLTPQQFGAQFGPADADIQTVTSWLSSRGFTSIRVAPGRNVIEFSGNVGQVRSTFHTEIHKFVVNGEQRQSNVSDPQLPAALTPVVAGVVSLHNFPSKSMRQVVGQFTHSRTTGETTPLFTTSGGNYAVGPADFAK